MSVRGPHYFSALFLRAKVLHWQGKKKHTSNLLKPIIFNLHNEMKLVAC